ncbi:MAG: ROK family protein [Anaerolineae bacterium]|nr:ROK family protein [Anaerolineae bacterium]
MEILGIDIGGSGIKGAPVDTARGVLTAERHRIPTPHPATPDDIIEVVTQLIDHFTWKGSVGCTFPAIIKHGVTFSAANVDKAWIGFEAEAALREATGCEIMLINDADAAGLAEMRFGAGQNHQREVVFVLTLGTGIGSAIFVSGELLPNAELGHLEINGKEAEKWTADSARKRKDLTWKEWAMRLNAYLSHLEFLFSPDVFILGGGASKKFDKFEPFLTTQALTVPARLRNEAGIVGAALAATRLGP